MSFLPAPSFDEVVFPLDDDLIGEAQHRCGDVLELMPRSRNQRHPVFEDRDVIEHRLAAVDESRARLPVAATLRSAAQLVDDEGCEPSPSRTRTRSTRLPA